MVISGVKTKAKHLVLKNALKHNSIISVLPVKAPSRFYFSLGHHLRNRYLLPEADSVLLKGISYYPGNVSLYCEYAETAMTKKDWAEAASRWQKILDIFSDKTPVNVYSRLSKAYRHQHILDKAENILLEGMKYYPAHTSLIKEHAEYYIKTKNWDAAIPRCQTVIDECKEKASPKIFTVLGKALRRKGLLHEAENIMTEGLLYHPSHLPVYREYAEIAMTRKEWQEAARRWQEVINKFKDEIPSAVYARYGKVLKMQGLYEQAEIILNEGISKCPHELESYMEYVKIAMAKRDWDEAIKRAEIVKETFSERTPGSLQRLIYHADSCKKYLGDMDYSGEKCHRELLNGNYCISLKYFEELLPNLNLGANEQVWLNNYEQLISILSRIDGLNNNNLDDNLNNNLDSSLNSSLDSSLDKGLGNSHDNNLDNYLINDAKTGYKKYGDNTSQTSPGNYVSMQKILVSGMGWSGSGALYDFFREFETVDYFQEFEKFDNVLGEPRFLDGKYSLYALYEKLGQPERFKKELINFFWFTLFGYTFPYNYSQFKCMNHAKVFLHGKNGYHYAESVNTLMNNLNKYSFVAVDNFISDNYISIVSEFVDAVFKPGTYDIKTHKFVLLDNVIFLKNILTTQITDNFHICCTFRDPRSNYVARVQEDPKFADSADVFIRRYRMIRENFSNNLQAIPQKKSSIHQVQFEEFVLSEDYRNRLAEKIGLEAADQNKYRFFKPWVSEKNIFNYKSFHDQNAIKLIAAELPEYCRNEF